MNEQIKEAAVISASPKAAQEQALSEYFSSLGERCLAAGPIKVNRINVRQSFTKGKTKEAFETMMRADALIFVFPLYFFCLPGLLMRFLQDYEQFFTEHGEKIKKAKIFAVVNSGFPEPEINGEAVRVIESFSRKIGADFRFGVLIGGCGMIMGTKELPFMKKTMAEIDSAFAKMKEDITGSGLSACENIAVKVNFPRRLYFFMGNSGWKASARKNGRHKKDLYRKTYRL